MQALPLVKAFSRTIAAGITLAALASAGVLATSCNRASSGGPGEEVQPGPPSGSSEDPPPDARKAEFGLDVRPPNPTCVAPARPPAPAAGGVKFERVYADVKLAYTMAMAQPPGDGTRWFVASRVGKILSFPSQSPPAVPSEVADVGRLAGRPVMAEMEGGLLGFAFHPRFVENGRLYVTWTTTEGGSPASEVGYLTSTDAGRSFTTYTKLLSFKRTRFEHCGGGIAFSKAGYLHLGFGDMANDSNGQRALGFSARILRIDVDKPTGGKPYGIPSSNPFKNAVPDGEAPEVYAKGFRNPFRLSFDRETDDLWVGDVGNDGYEELNRVQAGGNYGWPCREGAHDYKTTSAWLCPSTQGLIDPIVEHRHVVGGRSITAGVVYRGNAMPGFHGTHVYGDFIKNELWALPSAPTAASVATPTLLNEAGPSLGPTHFAEDNDGEIYVTTVLGNEIYKMVPTDPAAVSTFPDRLSKTGCFEPSDPKKPVAGMIPFGVNAPLWSDGAEKERFLAVPDGETITVGPDGDFDLPPGSVLAKSFARGGKLLETRLFVRHDDGAWAGYSYEWNDAQTDAVLLESGKIKSVADGSWAFPSRTDCMRCHTEAAGRSLGPELAQLNGDHLYPSTNRIANQLRTLEHLGLFAAPLGKPPEELAAYPHPHGDAPVEQRARAYLHGNCSMCHRPNGGAARAPMDFRYGTPFADTHTCNVASVIDDLGVPDAKVLTPGHPESSLISLRVHALDGSRMPPMGSSVVDPAGVKLLDDWIRAAKCP